MATLDQLGTALINADKAGDTEAARALAAEIRRMRGTPQQPEPDYGPTNGMSTFDKVAAGAGKAMVDLGRGAGQFLGLTSRDDVAESRKRDAPLMATTEGKVGNFAGNVAMLAPTALIPGANTVVGAGAIGAGAGLLQPSTSTAETATNALIGMAGGAGGQAVMNRIGAAAARPGNALTQGQQAAMQGGQDLGMRLTPGKASGSTTLQKMEAALESNPLTSAGFDGIKQGNQRVVNRSAARSIGENVDELSAPVLHRAEQRIGAVFNQVADATPVQLDPVQVGGRLRQIAQDSDGMLMGNAQLVQNGLWQRLDGFVNGQGGASREQLRTLSSNLGKAARNNMTSQNGDRALGEALFGAQEVVEDAIQGTLSQAQQAAYAEARNQYRNLMTLTAKTNVVNPANGNVSGRGLANTLMQKDRGGYTMGRNGSEMYDAARFNQAFPDIVGNSGTATRSMGPADYITGIPGNVLTRLYLSQPVTAAASAGAGAVGTGARLMDNRLLRLLAQPAGATAGLQLGNALQQQ